MTQVYQEVIEPYSINKMFSLVCDIKNYPKFVPDCVEADIISQNDNTIKAFVKVEKMGFKKSFTTLNTIDSPHCIKMQLVEGPFKHLSGEWRFIALSENRCKVSLALAFEFNNKLLNIALSPIFTEIMNNMVHAFTLRARQIY